MKWFTNLCMLRTRPRLVGEVRQRLDGQWFWHIKGLNNEVVCHAEGFTRREDAERSLLLVVEAKIEVIR